MQKAQLLAPRLLRQDCSDSIITDNVSCRANRAQELIERWSRPIFEQYREQREDGDLRERELQLRQARSARQKAQAAAHDEEEAQKRVRSNVPPS